MNNTNVMIRSLAIALLACSGMYAQEGPTKGNGNGGPKTKAAQTVPTASIDTEAIRKQKTDVEAIATRLDEITKAAEKWKEQREAAQTKAEAQVATTKQELEEANKTIQAYKTALARLVDINKELGAKLGELEKLFQIETSTTPATKG